MNKVLTVPKAHDSYKCYFMTGNEYISIPHIDQDGSIKCINAVLMCTRTLIEFRGEKLISPYIQLDGKICNLREKLHGDHLNYWIPQFECQCDDVHISIIIVSPVNHKGFVYRIALHNRGGKAIKARQAGAERCLERLLRSCIHI